MERHQAGQEETLVEVRMETGSLEAVHRPRGSPADHRGCFKCAVALAVVMGLVIVALVAAFILYFFMFTTSCNQEATPLSDPVSIISKLKNSDDKLRYDIFTAKKDGKYLITVWVELSGITREEFTLKTWRQEAHERTIEKKDTTETEIFFFQRLRLAKDTRVSIYFNSTCTDSLFHVYEL